MGRVQSGRFRFVRSALWNTSDSVMPGQRPATNFKQVNMRNKFPGICYWCHKTVVKGAGHFEKHKSGWRTIHAACVFEQRKEKEENDRNSEHR